MPKKCSFALLLLASVSVASAAPTVHLENARSLVSHMRAQGELGMFFDQNNVEYNQYGANWANVVLDYHEPAYANAVCSSFLTRLLMDSYAGWTAKGKGFASASPTAAVYHEAVSASFGGFREVKVFENIKPGDILAAKYLDGSADTGHIMIVNDAIAGPPDAKGYIRWSVQVIDCSKSTHSTDTRGFPNYTSRGVGMGWMYIWTRWNKIVSYAWSQRNGSIVYTPEVRHLVLGRLVL
ncbi:MAG TPA: hypothetical protein VK934_02805 [Fimbriimonas sp.]|nr:hypothetical protein [Fimbriimonas sp.]